MPKGAELHIKVAGVTFEGRQDVLGWMDEHRDYFKHWGTVLLRPEPDNEYDPNAIQVLVRSEAGWFQVGYVPRERTAQVHEMLKAGPTVARVKKLGSKEMWGDEGPRDVWYLQIAARNE